MARLLTTKELADKLNYAPLTIRNWVAAGKIKPFIKKDKNARAPFRFDYEEVLKALRGK